MLWSTLSKDIASRLKTVSVLNFYSPSLEPIEWITLDDVEDKKEGVEMTEETAENADEETKDELELEPEFEIEFEGNFQKYIIFSMKV